jgi:hypothetical protein
MDLPDRAAATRVGIRQPDVQVVVTIAVGVGQDHGDSAIAIARA